MKEKIEKKIKELEELYDYNLQKSEDINYISNWKVIESRLHDLKIEINTYKKVMEILENEVITNEAELYRIKINNYIYASKLFNDKYSNKYQIRILNDLNFLNIYLDNLQNKKVTKVQIFNIFISNLSPEKILEAYEELINEVSD